MTRQGDSQWVITGSPAVFMVLALTEKIARKTGLSRNTVAKWLRAPLSVE